MKIELPLILVEYTFRAQDDMMLPNYSGSALRGVFGSSLRRICCLAKQENCAGCRLITTCPYAVIFESKSGLQNRYVNPYVIEPLPFGKRLIKKGERFSFRQILFGREIKQLSFIILAWVKGMQGGMGRTKSRAELVQIVQHHPERDIYLYGGDDSRLEVVEKLHPIEIPEEVKAVEIQIQTPLRIQREKHPITPAEITAGDFVSGLLRRLELLYASHTDLPPFWGEKKEILAEARLLTIERKELHWQDWTRWSGRQKQHISLGGIVGTFKLCGEMKSIIPLLIAGSIVHIGKSTVMGLGKYALTVKK